MCGARDCAAVRADETIEECDGRLREAGLYPFAAVRRFSSCTLAMSGAGNNSLLFAVPGRSLDNCLGNST